MHRRDLFRSAASTGLALGLAAADRPLFALSGKEKPEGDDIVLMNTALALEHQAIWAYGLAGKSGLLSEKAKEVGLLFQGSHEIHRDLLVGAIRGKGAAPVEPKNEYVFGVPLTNEKDVLELAFKLEVGAARAVLVNRPAVGKERPVKLIECRQLAKGQIMHQDCRGVRDVVRAAA